jgi:hypothetical protein
VHNLGAFRYVLSERAGRDDALLAEVRREVIAVAGFAGNPGDSSAQALAPNASTRSSFVGSTAE